MSNNPYSKHNIYSPYTTPTYYSRSRNHHQQQQQQQPPKKIHINPNFTSGASSTASSTTTSGALNNDSEAPIYVNVPNPSSSSTPRVIVNPKVIHANNVKISYSTFYLFSVPISESRVSAWKTVSQDAHQPQVRQPTSPLHSTPETREDFSSENSVFLPL